jgi:hypothetical protein
LSAVAMTHKMRMEDDSEQEVPSAILEPIDLFIFQKVTSLEPNQ